MADSGLKWFLGLDSSNLGAGASSAQKKLSDLEAKMHAVRKVADETTDKALSRRLGSKLLSLQVEHIDAVTMAAANRNSGAWITHLNQGVELLKTIGDAALRVGETIADWTKSTIHAAGGKEREYIGLKGLLGDGPKAKRMMEDFAALSDKSIFSEEQTAGIGKRLLAAGGEFNSGNVTTYIKALGDAAAATGKSAEDVDGAVSAMIRINAQGKLTEKTLLALGKAGIPIQGIYQQLARDFHTTEAGVKALMKAGKVSANEGLFSAVSAVAGGRSGGVLGSAGERAVSESSDRLLDKIGEKWKRNFSNIWDTRGFGKWEGFLRNLNTALDGTTESGKRLKESIGGAFDKLLEGVLGKLSGEEGFRGAADLVDRLANGIDAVGTAAGGLAKGMLGGLGDALGKIDIGKQLDPEQTKLLSTRFQELGKTISEAASNAAELLGTIAKIVGYVPHAANSIERAGTETGLWLNRHLGTSGASLEMLGTAQQAMVEPWKAASVVTETVQSDFAARQASVLASGKYAVDASKTIENLNIHIGDGQSIDAGTIAAIKTGVQEALNDSEDFSMATGSYVP